MWIARKGETVLRQPDSVEAFARGSKLVGALGDPGSGKGSVSLRFYSDDDLIRVLKIMGVNTDIG